LKLAAWRKREGKTQEWLAAELGCSQPYVSQIERAQDAIIPGADIMERVFIVSEGAVEPNDFYDVPRWRRALSAALAALTGKAA
jgi:transcriptional regulator with XRE-family HTH domain